MKILELFAGMRCIGMAFEEKGHDVFSIDWNKSFKNIDLYVDIGTLNAEDIIKNFGVPDVIWASPDCTSYSIAAISHHRIREEDGNLRAKSEYANFCDKTNLNVINMINQLCKRNQKLIFFIENPRGGMRKMNFMKGLPRYTVTYCQYGDDRMKPTDIWTNHPSPQFKPMCKRGSPCHIPAPRGSKTGTQGLKGSVERSLIPAELCRHIVQICEDYYKNEVMN